MLNFVSTEESGDKSVFLKIYLFDYNIESNCHREKNCYIAKFSKFLNFLENFKY